MDNNIDPKVGEVWLVDLSNATGHQQRGIRPFVVKRLTRLTKDSSSKNLVSCRNVR